MNIQIKINNRYLMDRPCPLEIFGNRGFTGEFIFSLKPHLSDNQKTETMLLKLSNFEPVYIIEKGQSLIIEIT